MKNKKAQTSVFMAIIILTIMLMVVLMEMKQKSAEVQVVRTASGLKDYTRNYIAANTVSFPYITYNGIPLEELIGAYACYNDEIADYGVNMKFNVTETLRTVLDEIYGSENWAVLITKENSPKLPDLPFIVDGSGSMDDDIEIITQIRDIISSESDIIRMQDLPSESTDCYQGGPQPEENWGGTSGYLCENGRPVKSGSSYSFEPWSEDLPKVIFVSSDEFSCSSGSGAEEYSQNYVDDAIQKCTDAGVKIYYLMPTTYDFDIGQAEQLTDATGGKIISLNNAQDAITEIIAELGLSNDLQFRSQLQSSDMLTLKELPKDRDLFTYSSIVPCPCRPSAICRGVIIVSPSGGIK